MSIPMGTALLSFSDGVADGGVGGIVESSGNDHAVVAVGEDSVRGVRPGDACVVRYTDPDTGRFLRVRCEIVAWEGGRVTLRPAAEPEPANQRSSFRVPTARADFTATVGGHHNCPVIDVSANGLRVRVPAVMCEGDSVDVRLSVSGISLQGRFEVRRSHESSEGICVGLRADAQDAALSAALAKLVAEVQRAHLRRRARLNSGVQASGTDEPEAAAEEVAQEVAEAAGEEAWVRVPAALLADRALPGSLKREDGAVVASRGQVLSYDELARLGANGLFACSDWAANEREQARTPDDRRVCGRSDCAGGIVIYSLQGDRVVRLRSELVDISRGGVGLRSPTVLPNGSHVVLDFSNGGTSRWILGRVVHAGVGQGELTCRIGVRFMLSAPQTGPVPDSVRAFGDWVSVKPGPGQRKRAAR